MPRPRRCRRISHRPHIRFFKPAGVGLMNLGEEILTFDEIEAMRLIDLEGIEQEKAAKKMEISQPTLSRLLSSVRKKIAHALVKGKAIKIAGGNFEMTHSHGGLGLGRGRVLGIGKMKGLKSAGPGGNCICPKCGHEEPHHAGEPCFKKKCPKCASSLTRE